MYVETRMSPHILLKCTMLIKDMYPDFVSTSGIVEVLNFKLLHKLVLSLTMMGKIYLICFLKE